jgi:hypothetical protein
MSMEKVGGRLCREGRSHRVVGLCTESVGLGRRGGLVQVWLLIQSGGARGQKAQQAKEVQRSLKKFGMCTCTGSRDKPSQSRLP